MCVITLDTAFDTEAVVCCNRSNALDLVGRDGDAQASAADEQCAVSFALGDEASGGGGPERIRCLVGDFVGSYVDDFAYASVAFKVLFDCVFVADAGVLYEWLLVSVWGAGSLYN